MRRFMIIVPLVLLVLVMRAFTLSASAEWHTTTDRGLLTDVKNAFYGDGNPPSWGWQSVGIGPYIFKISYLMDSDQQGGDPSTGGVKQWVAAVTSAVAGVDNSLDTNAATGDGVRRLLELIRADLADLETAVSAGGGGGTDMTDTIAAINDLDARIDAITAAVNTHSGLTVAAINDLDWRIDAITTAVGTHQTATVAAVDAVAAHLVTSNAALASIDEGIEWLTDAFWEGFTNEDVAALLGYVDGLETDLASARASLTTIASAVSGGAMVISGVDTASIVTELQVLQTQIDGEFTDLENILQTGNIALEAQLIRAKLGEIRTDTQSTVTRLIDIHEMLDAIYVDTTAISASLTGLVTEATTEALGLYVRGPILNSIAANTAPLHADLVAIGVDVGQLRTHAASIDGKATEIAASLVNLGVKLDAHKLILEAIDDNTWTTADRLFTGDKSAAVWLSEIAANTAPIESELGEVGVLPVTTTNSVQSQVTGTEGFNYGHGQTIKARSPLYGTDGHITLSASDEGGVDSLTALRVGTLADAFAVFNTATAGASASSTPPPPIVFTTPTVFGITGHTFTITWGWFDGGVRTAVRTLCIICALGLAVTMVWSEFSRS